MELIIEYEQITRRCRLGIRHRFEHLDGIDIEEPPENLVHRQECSSRAAGTNEEATPVDAQLFTSGLTEFLDSRLHLLLLRGLAHGHVLTV
jgi:hypothetical protein